MNKPSMFEANYSKLLALQQCHIAHTLLNHCEDLGNWMSQNQLIEPQHN